MEQNIITPQALESFRQAVLNSARKEKQEKEAQIKQQQQQLLQSAVLAAENNAKAKVNKETAAVKAAVNRQLLDQSFSAKKELLRRRMIIHDEIFDCVKQKILAFVETEEYVNKVKKDFKEALLYRFSDRVIIFLPTADHGEKQLAEKYFPLASLKRDESIVLGGIKIEDTKKHIVLDYTIDKNMSLAQEKFLDISGLSAKI